MAGKDLTAVADAIARTESPADLFERVSDRLRRLVPFDGSAWFAMDPGSLLATLPVRIENIESGHCSSYWEREIQVEDVLLFRDLGRSEAGIGTLHDATGGSPTRSARAREFLIPQGYDDELRAAFRYGPNTWGVLDIFRERGRPAFSAEDVDVVRRLSPLIASALRTFAAESTRTSGELDVAGTALLDTDLRLLSFDEQADRWLTEVSGPGWSTRPLGIVAAVGARALTVASGRDHGPASARMRTHTGRWLLVQASCLRLPDGGSGPVAVTVGPAKSSQMAPIIVEAYGLTPREQEITQAVARGLSNAEIAAAHHLSQYTVRDHLKAIFTKTGVTTRGELVAKLFAEHYGPALHAGDERLAHVEV